MGLGMPSFWFGIILIVLFSVDLHWFPVGGYGTSFWPHLHSLILPGLCAAIGIVPVLIRSLRVGMLEVLGADYVATARARGCARRGSPSCTSPATPSSRRSPCSASTSPTSSGARS